MSQNRYRIVDRESLLWFGMGDKIEVLSSEASAHREGDWIDVEEREAGVFTVVRDSMTMRDLGPDWLSLRFRFWDDEVEDLDAGNSSGSECFGSSNHLRWNDVDLTPEEFHAPSIERLAEALTHVAVDAWNPEDV